VRTRVVVALLAFGVAVAGCGTSAAPESVSVAPVAPSPSGASQVTTAPDAGNEDCGDREASLRPGRLPSPGAMPPGSPMAAIADRGRLIVGVDQNTQPMGYRNPATRQVEGFDIDIAREIARAIFGDPDRIQPRVVNANQREAVLQSGEVDLVVRTYSITCARKKSVDFSAVYYYANQKILSANGSGLDSPEALAGKPVCAVSGTTSLAKLYALNPRPNLFGVATWTDCLLMLQQGQVDAISTDDSVLAGLKIQDHLNMQISDSSLGVEPYGIGVKKDNGDLVKFVNGVLEQMRDDGTWERIYNKWLRELLGPSPGPPQPRYRD
jgi:polar amino acid transport system substrate-binding protein